MACQTNRKTETRRSRLDLSNRTMIDVLFGCNVIIKVYLRNKKVKSFAMNINVKVKRLPGTVKLVDLALHSTKILFALNPDENSTK